MPDVLSVLANMKTSLGCIVLVIQIIILLIIAGVLKSIDLCSVLPEPRAWKCTSPKFRSYNQETNGKRYMIDVYFIIKN